ncbi:MAG: hypothetical protein CL907_04295 [Dehalococcoidia bacterium]|nr:hypothetical protein [Dehalococcoidia bacterium]|tara:strand:+ start:858 stop:1928 length:1071 start_codon:yes stop_codon:yes gene_type:complete
MKKELRSPKWTKEETMIVLNFYLNHRPSIPNKNSEEILKLSSILNIYGQKNGIDLSIYPKYRNPNGVYMKCMNMKSVENPGTGLSNRATGSGIEQIVWDEYSGDPNKLKREVDQLINFNQSHSEIPNFSWLDTIIIAYKNLGGDKEFIHYSKVYLEVKKIRKSRGLTWPSSAEAQIRKNVEVRSQDSDVWDYTKPDIFEKKNPNKNTGYWKLKNYETDYDFFKKYNELPQKEQRKYTTINRIIRNTKIIRQIKEMYKNVCQICKTKIRLNNGKYYSEGAHIKPLGNNHKGKDAPNNILCLCPNCHTKLDLGVIYINDYMRVIETYSNNSWVLNFEDGHNIDIENIRYHKKYIYKLS